MASGMKWALAVTGLTAALGLAIVRGGMPGLPAEYGAQSEVWRSSAELAATRGALLQWSTLDSVRAILPDSGVVFDVDGTSEAQHVISELRDSIAAELAVVGGSRARMAVLALAGSDRPGLQRALMSVQYFAGVDSLGGWCAVVIDPLATNPLALRQAVFAGGSALGPCAFWAQHGAPGDALAAALPQFGHFLGAPRPGPADAAAPTRGLFGTRPWQHPVAPHVVAQACVAGRIEACDRALHDPLAWSASFFGIDRTPDDAALLVRGRYVREANPSERMLADLRTELGDEAFMRFWRADGHLNDALAAATGTSAAEWMHRWAVARFGTEPRGPTLDALTLLLTLLAMAALAAASLLVAQRRRIP